jgi:tetratricopeptide (TPR) repeat protein/nucleoside phosphorylase
MNTDIETTAPILIVVVTKVEVQAILKAFSVEPRPSRHFVGNKIYYKLGVQQGGATVFMVQSEKGTATPGGALMTVRQAIQDLRPQAVIMCGIAYGLRPDKQKLGDILIAQQLEYYEPQKVDIKNGKIPRGDRATTSETLLDRFRSADLDWNGAPTHFGLVLSGEKLVNDPDFRDWLLEREPEAIGGEMEGAGLYTAARAAKVDWILVKAICDWADGEKTDDAQELAAHHAAQFVFHTLQLGEQNDKTSSGEGIADPLNIDIDVLPFRNEIFLGRHEELQTLENWLTGDRRPRIITIYGAGGQGKTTLARQAVQRFGQAWPGGVLAISFENLPTRQDIVLRLVAFLRIDAAQMTPAKIESRVIRALEARRTLLVLDNAETLVDALDHADPAAADLVDFLQNQLPPTVTLLITSRRRMGLPGEEPLDLGGLSPADGAQLFQQSAPQRKAEIDLKQAGALSETVQGHPLSLRLLGIAFNDFGPGLDKFILQFEQQLKLAIDKYKNADHRQRTLFTSIETSISPLDPRLQALLGKLTLFHGAFKANTVAEIYDPDVEESPIPSQLRQLWQRGVVEREVIATGKNPLEVYRLLPPLRLYAEQGAIIEPQTWQRFAQVYGRLITWIRDEIDKGPTAALLARLTAVDLERGLEHNQEAERGWYNIRLGWVEYRLGNPWKGRPRVEQALASGRGRDQKLMLRALNELGQIYNSTGQPQEALKCYQEALPVTKETNDRAEQAATLTNIGEVYHRIGQPQEALKHYQEALPIRKEVVDRTGEALTLHNIGLLYDDIGQPQEALKYYREALLIRKEISDRAGEATTLNNIGMVYGMIGQPQEALKYFREALPITKEVGDRAGEAGTLNNIGAGYNHIGQPREALKYYREALPIMKEVGDRAGEAATLNNIGGVYNGIGQPQEALKYCREALPIMKEVGDRAGEAATLNNIGGAYNNIGQSQEALKYFREALPILKEVSDRAGEATTLSNMAALLANEGKNQQALDLLQQALIISQEIGTVNLEAAILYSMASLLAHRLNATRRALPLLQRSIKLMETNGLLQDDASITLSHRKTLLARLEKGRQSKKK